MGTQLPPFETKQEHLEQEVRLRQLASILSRAGGELTLKQIATRAGMAKSKHVLDLLGLLVDEGVITWKWDKTRNGLNVRKFSITRWGIQWVKATS